MLHNEIHSWLRYNIGGNKWVACMVVISTLYYIIYMYTWCTFSMRYVCTSYTLSLWLKEISLLCGFSSVECQLLTQDKVRHYVVRVCLVWVRVCQGSNQTSDWFHPTFRWHTYWNTWVVRSVKHTDSSPAFPPLDNTMSLLTVSVYETKSESSPATSTQDVGIRNTPQTWKNTGDTKLRTAQVMRMCSF